jgi:RNA recognition motif-containing protein
METTNLFIGNLSWDTEEGDLRKLFEPFGKVVAVRLITDKATGHSRGFGFIEMERADDAARAMSSLDGVELGGRTLRIDKATKPARARI